MLTITSRSKVPAGGYWRYVDPETKVTVKHPYLVNAEILAKQHRMANNLPIGSNWSQQFEENVCAQHPDLCLDKPPDLFDKTKSISIALYNWAKSGFKIVSEEVFNERKAICLACEFYKPGRTILTVGCKRCGCAGVKLWLGSEKCPITKWISV